tara:strand:+ start:255 stop:446 length:192 start_codon:yes stop_codon:yes gene_type:complete
MFIFNFYNTAEFLIEKENVIKNILPKLRKKLNDLHAIQNTDEIQKEIENKEIIIKSLKYYYTI